jgi:hypothetical protein
MSNMLIFVVGVGELPATALVSSSTEAPDSLVATLAVDQPTAAAAAAESVLSQSTEHAALAIVEPVSDSDALLQSGDAGSASALPTAPAQPTSSNAVPDDSSSADASASGLLGAIETPAASSLAAAALAEELP